VKSLSRQGKPAMKIDGLRWGWLSKMYVQMQQQGSSAWLTTEFRGPE
jgi:hypothetical protein